MQALSLFCWLATGLNLRSADLPPGEGEPFMQHFSPRDYRGEAQCWCFAQDRRRVMYVGNVGAVSEYDGTSWHRVSIHQSELVTALAYDSAQDAVFVGVRGDVGYLKLLPDGTREYVSLLNKLPPALRDVGFIANVYAVPGAVFFVGATQVMRWQDGRFKVWPLETDGKLTSAWIDGHFYVHNPRIGLLRLDADTFVPASGDPLFRRASVRAILPSGDGALLIGAYHDGIYILRRDGVAVPWPVDCNDYLKAKGIYRMLRLRDGSLAVATDTAGLLLLDQEGHFRNRVDGTGGMHGSDLLSLYQDAEEGLWIGLQSGCTRAEVCSPLSILRAGPEDDLTNTGESGAWFGTTVMGNSTGLYQVVPAAPAAFSGPRLRHLSDSIDPCTSLSGVENGLLAVSSGKVLLLDAEAKLIPIQGEITAARNVFASHVFPGRVYVTDEGGHVITLRLDPKSGRWTVDKTVVSLGKPAEMSIVESSNGNLWLGTKEHGLFRVQWGTDGVAAVTALLDLPGPLHGERFILSHWHSGPACFNTHHRLYRLDAAEQNVVPAEGYLPPVNDGSLTYQVVTQFDGGSVWLAGKSDADPAGETVNVFATMGLPDRAPTLRVLPHKIQDVIGGIEAFVPTEPNALPSALLLLGSLGNGVVRLDVRRWEEQPPPPPFETVIRRAATVGRDSVPILQEPLPFKRNSVHFEFTAGTVAFGAAPRFQTRLAGFGAGDWSEWSDRTGVDYLNLPEGRYTFEAQARDADGRLGSVGTLPFRVLPPWPRAPLAYAAYALATLGGLWALVRWRGRQLRRRNVVLTALVDARTSELRGREAELVRARDEAESANRAKSAFLANMSHELRTPLNAILGYSQIMLKQAELSLRTREQATVIGQSGNHLLLLINEVLDLSKIEAGKLSLAPVDFALSQVLGEVTATFRLRIAEKGLSFTENRFPGLPVNVHSDPDRLRQVLLNLLGNAVKFTHAGGVTFSVQLVGAEKLRFEVSDTGVGIAADELRDIFLAFHQGRDSKLAVQGTGLGLAISQRLVGLLGGRIEVESEPGQGSRFWFDIPVSGSAILHDATRGDSAGSMRTAVTGYEGPRRRLLLVDDLAENRRVLRAFLQPLGFAIEEAADGEQCLAACDNHPPDAVLLDLRLGVLNGFEVARTLRARAHGAPRGIIAVSASVFEADRQRAIEVGCDAFLPKPLEEAQLLDALARVLDLRWTQAAPAVLGAVPGVSERNDEIALPDEEIAALLSLSLRGDINGLRKWLDAAQANGSSHGAASLVLQLKPLVAAYDMDRIHRVILLYSSKVGSAIQGDNRR